MILQIKNTYNIYSSLFLSSETGRGLEFKTGLVSAALKTSSGHRMLFLETLQCLTLQQPENVFLWELQNCHFTGFSLAITEEWSISMPP